MIQQRLEFSKKAADKWLPTWHGDKRMALFEATNGIDKYVINLADKTCSCRRWDLSVSLAAMQLHVFGLTTVSLRTL